MTLFQDEDGAAYLIYSSDQNRTMRIARLTDDYLGLDGSEQSIFIDQAREAPVLFRHEDRYYLLTSGCTGWEPNPSLVAVSDRVMGRWRLTDNPFEGREKETSFRTQGTWMFRVPGTDQVVYMGDRWNKDDLQDSRYVWLPVEWRDRRMVIRWCDEWELPHD